MGYLLVDAQVLKEKGLKQFETLPDGRGIVDFSMLRVLGSMSNVEVVSTSREVFSLINEQEQSGLYEKPEPDPTLPDLGMTEEGMAEEGPADPGMDGSGEVADGTVTETPNEEPSPNGDEPAGDTVPDAAVPEAEAEQTPADGETQADVPSAEENSSGAPTEETAVPEVVKNKTKGGKK